MRQQNLAAELFTHGRIKTSLTRAKAVLPIVDRVVNLAKKNTVSAKRQIVKILGRKKLLDKIIGEIAPKYKERNSGYSRIIRLGQRLSDSARLAILELVEETPEPPAEEKPGTKKKKS